jgi:riboflavin synthase
MPETVKKTTLSKLQRDDYVNLERALKLSDRMGGHIITGHIDHIGRIHHVEKSARSILMSIHTHQNFITYLVEKGSVAIDGISLTVLDFRDDEFRVSLLPFTLAKTTLGFRHSGDNVNLEGDVLAKYAIKLIHHSSSVQKKTITLDLLEEYGYFS